MTLNQEHTKETLDNWHKDHNNWKWGGLFYYNKEDKRLFVPKKLNGWESQSILLTKM